MDIKKIKKHSATLPLSSGQVLRELADEFDLMIKAGNKLVKELRDVERARELATDKLLEELGDASIELGNAAIETTETLKEFTDELEAKELKDVIEAGNRLWNAVMDKVSREMIEEIEEICSEDIKYFQ